MTEKPTMAEKMQLPPKISLSEAAQNLRAAQMAVNDTAKIRGEASKALRAADTDLVQAKHALELAERRVVLSALFETEAQPKPVPKTREEMSAFAKDWDAKVEANSTTGAPAMSGRILDVLDAAGVPKSAQFDGLVTALKLNDTQTGVPIFKSFDPNPLEAELNRGLAADKAEQ